MLPKVQFCFGLPEVAATTWDRDFQPKGNFAGWSSECHSFRFVVGSGSDNLSQRKGGA
jgi:hypothetical protein